MRLIRFLLVAVAISGIWHTLQAQQDCSQSLIQAARAYYTGRFADVEAILGTCINDGFDKQQRVEAYKLLALSSMFSRNNDHADSLLLMMLKIDPEFTPGPEDPPELQKRLETFDVRPKVGVSIGGGTYLPVIKVREVYNLRDIPSTVTYESSIGYQFGFGGSFYPTKHIILESSLAIQSFSFKVTKKNEFAETGMDEKQRRREFVIAGGYSHKWGRIYGQLLVGAAINSIKSANSSLYKKEKLVDGNGDVIEGEFTYREELNFPNYNRSGFDLRPLVIARISLVQKDGWLIGFSARYEHSSQEFAEDGGRYVDMAQLVKFDWIEDKFTANYFSAGLSISRLFYHVRK